MKAVIYEKYGPPEVLQVKELPKPTPKPNQLLVKIHAAAITKGDCEMRSPKIPDFTWFLVRLIFGLFKPRKKILGSYFAGEVEAVGKNASLFKKGDKIFGINIGFGAHAQYVCLSEKNTIASLPVNISYQEAAPVALALDSLHFLRKGKISKGDKVLINGAGGGIGTYALQLAIYYGADVTIVDTLDKHELLFKLGAQKAIDYTTGDFTKSGETYDLVFDVVGTLNQRRALRILKSNGRYISAIPLISRLLPNLWVSLSSDKKMMTGLTKASKKDLEFLKGLIEKRALKTVIDRTFKLEELAEAHQYIEQGLKKGNVVMLTS